MRGSQLPTLDRGSRTRADLRATEERSRGGGGGVASSIAHRFLRPSLLASRSSATAVAFCFGRAWRNGDFEHTRLTRKIETVLQIIGESIRPDMT